EVETGHVHAVAPESKVAVIPNGVDIRYFESSAEAKSMERPEALLFIGSMAYAPNQDAVFFFHREVWPLLEANFPDLKWWIVGRDPSAEVQSLASTNIRVTSWVEDVRPYMAASQAMVVPLRSGGGSRLKILEAMAARLPVVSTTIGAEGLSVSDGKDILLADESRQFADTVTRLFQEPSLAQRMRTNGRHLVEARYDW
ncbi:unnamed protein product, partial [marine sediment metagenome]